MTLARACALAALVLVLAPRAEARDGFRCDGGLVGVGDLTVDLLARCGSPSLIDRWTEEREALAVNVEAKLAAAERTTIEVEQWTYDFGTSSFIQQVTFHNGVAVSVSQGSYGHGTPRVEARRPRVSRCEPSAFHVGDLKVDALARCGEPAAIHTWQGPRTTPVVVTGGAVIAASSPPARMEQWVYNLGPSWFMRVLLFENGRVVAVSSGNKGYAE